MARFLDVSIFKRNHALALLYSGQFVSFLGTIITLVALPFQVYQATHSTMMVGVLSLVQLLPLLFTALMGGVLADRYPRRMLLLISEFILAGGCIILACNASLVSPHLYIIFTLSGIMSALAGLHRPAFDGAIQQLVKEEDYKTVGALRAFQFSFCMIAGPAITGWIIAQWGVTLTFWVDLATFVISITTLLKLKSIPKPKTQKDASVFEDLKEGIQFAWRRPVLLGSYCIDFIAMFFAMPNALFPAIALSIGGVKTLGYLYAAPAAGALIISIWSGWTAYIQHEGRAIAISAIAWGGSMICFGLTHSLTWALFFLALSGAFDACSGIFRASLWNSTIPQHLRGRLAGIEMLSYISGPKLGDARAGLTATVIGIYPAIISGGVLCIVGVGYCCYRMSDFWRYRAHAE